MLDLRRLRLLRELHARGTIAAVADALQYTPSAVSQQLAVLERETGRTLLTRAGRGVRLTDDALVLVGHAEVLLRQAELAEADLAAAAGGGPAGRARIASFQSMAMRVAIPAIGTLAQTAPGLRCELIEAEPEQSLPALALGDLDLVLADEWRHQPRARPDGVVREDILLDPVSLVLPEAHPAARGRSRTAGAAAARRATARRRAVPLASLADAPWVTGHPGTGWEEMTVRACRELGGFDPDVRHRANDSAIGLALVAAGQAVMMLPQLVGPEGRAGVAVRPIAEGTIDRTIFMATRAADAKRPSVVALRDAVRAAAAAVERER